MWRIFFTMDVFVIAICFTMGLFSVIDYVVHFPNSKRNQKAQKQQEAP